MPLWSSVALALLSLLVLATGIYALLQARRRKSRGLYQRQLESALADGSLSADEIAELERLRQAKDLSSAEVRTIARAIYRRALNDALHDDHLSPEEDQALRGLQTQLNLSEAELERDHLQLSRLRLLAQVANGHLPVVEPPIPLVPQETCHWVVQTSFAERLGLARKADALRGIRLSVSGDEPLTVKGERDSLRPSEAILPIDLGVLVITSRRTHFQGAKRTLTIPHARLEHILLYADGIRLDELGGNAKAHLLVDDAEVTAAIMLQAARRRRAEIRPVRPGRTA
jgi:hypothetical protein